MEWPRIVELRRPMETFKIELFGVCLSHANSDIVGEGLVWLVYLHKTAQPGLIASQSPGVVSCCQAKVQRGVFPE